ncbi:MAG: hypothetical protein KDA93_10450 [Planctomycetaceae bacterium]|nr:hypothetical protein [Planctomycetaceae bacterium]
MRYRFPDGSDMEKLLHRLEALNFRAAIVGPEGSGKTTLQEDMAYELITRGHTIRWLRLNWENRRTVTKLIEDLFSTSSERDLLFVDGAEQMGALRWRLFTRRADRYGGLVINTHAAGRLPTLWECQTTPELLSCLIDELLASNSSLPIGEVTQLFDQNDGNLRLCLREMYDRWADAQYS